MQAQRGFRWVMFAAAALAGSAAASAAENDIAQFKHMGVASCATSVCHGKVAPQPGKNVALNEYRLWSQDDRHAQAYRTLESAESKRMAARLGIPNAAASKLCLDCHADNVPAAKRGPKFQISDGVGCESCHGGGEKWLESHANGGATHKDNLARGMYPSEQPLARAQLCLSCHLGTKDRFATHMIMGAGHPRLNFELEAFTANQPAHYEVDEDYVRRKGKIEGANLWVTGQMESAQRMATLLQTTLFYPAGMFPEFAFYDCHSCHHPMDRKRASAQASAAGVKPGALRLQTQSLLMLQVLAGVIESPSVPQLAATSESLVRAGQADAASVKAAAGKLLAWLQTKDAWTSRNYTRAEVVALRRALVTFAAADKARDYATAEQVVLGVESLSYSLRDRDSRKAALDALYKAVESDAAFDPVRFAAEAKRVQAQF
jgi:hypothetical protein